MLRRSIIFIAQRSQLGASSVGAAYWAKYPNVRYTLSELSKNLPSLRHCAEAIRCRSYGAGRISATA
jgi:hypothetical protein